MDNEAELGALVGFIRTVKETLLRDSETLNLNAPDKTYSALHDEAKTTVKETMIHDSQTLNIKGRTTNYISKEDKMKKTIKETLPVIDTVRNIGKSQYKVSLYDPDNVVKKTTKETTIKGKSEYESEKKLVKSKNIHRQVPLRNQEGLMNG